MLILLIKTDLLKINYFIWKEFLVLEGLYSCSQMYNKI